MLVSDWIEADLRTRRALACLFTGLGFGVCGGACTDSESRGVRTVRSRKKGVISDGNAYDRGDSLGHGGIVQQEAVLVEQLLQVLRQLPGDLLRVLVVVEFL